MAFLNRVIYKEIGKKKSNGNELSFGPVRSWALIGAPQTINKLRRHLT